MVYTSNQHTLLQLFFLKEHYPNYQTGSKLNFYQTAQTNSNQKGKNASTFFNAIPTYHAQKCLGDDKSDLSFKVKITLSSLPKILYMCLQ